MLNGLRDELTALARARVDEAIGRLDLVRREEFEAMAELAGRARAEAEALSLRVAALEQRFAAVPEATTDQAAPHDIA
ncbi:MAG: hypothetical protein B7X48_06970 [Acidiphilium sp. 34-60-192]|nr:MAG: hypothetical protein B7X48_06970 [Acidiphilium sp. 34-60-192]